MQAPLGDQRRAFGPSLLWQVIRDHCFLDCVGRTGLTLRKLLLWLRLLTVGKYTTR